jgi:hypothetical protein
MSQQGTQATLTGAAQIAAELSQLHRRQETLTAEAAAATAEASRASAALAVGGGEQQLEAAARARAKASALAAALAALDDPIAASAQALDAALAGEKWNAALDRMLPAVEAAAEAVRSYEEHAAAVNDVLVERVPLMAAAYRKWETARLQFEDAMRALIPGVTPTPAADLYGKMTTSPEAAAAADRLVNELAQRCADLRPALAPVAGVGLCVDVKNYQIALREPYGSTPHVLAQALVYQQKEDEKRAATRRQQ